MPNTAKLLTEATTHHQAGRLDEAEKAYRKLLRAEAINKDGLRLLGGLYLQRRQWGEAVECLEKAVRFMGDDPETLTNLGVALHNAGHQDEAAVRYEQALKLKPDYLTALNNLGSYYLEKNKPTTALTLFGQALREHPDNPAAHYNYGNALLATGKTRDAAIRYEHALKLKPDYLEAMINLGMALGQMGKAEQSHQWLQIARTWFDKALVSDPNNTVAMNNIGNVLREQGKPQEATVYYRKALALRPDYADAAINLATSLRDQNLFEEAIESCRYALKLQPNSADARINLGAFLQDLARHEEAVAMFDEGLQIKPSSLDAKWNKSLSLLALGRYEEGLALHEIGLGVIHMRGEYPSPERRWQGENFVGKRLMIWCEQGLGDSLQFIRYAALCKARGGTVIVVCPRALRSLFSNCPFIDALPETVEESDFDLHVPMMSLPYIFGTQVDTILADIPYLQISEAVRAKWAERLADKTGFKVGLVWAGNPRENQINANLIDRRRSMTLELLRPLFDVPNAQFYNLQKGAMAAQIDTCGLRDRFIDLMPDVKNFEDTGAIVEKLDLVISVDTSVVHLVGGMGKPVWVLSRYDACWRWLQNRPDNPWYPTARVFGQTTPGDWAGVVAAIRQALIKTVE